MDHFFQEKGLPLMTRKRLLLRFEYEPLETNMEKIVFCQWSCDGDQIFCLGATDSTLLSHSFSLTNIISHHCDKIKYNKNKKLDCSIDFIHISEKKQVSAHKNHRGFNYETVIVSCFFVCFNMILDCD